MYFNVTVNYREQRLAGLMSSQCKYLLDKIIYSLNAVSFELQQKITTLWKKQ